MPLGVLLPHMSRLELIRSQGRFLLHGFVVCFREGEHRLPTADTRSRRVVSRVVARLFRRASAYLYRFLVRLFMVVEIAQGETLCPVPLVKVHEHRLLELRLPVVHGDRVVVPVKSVNECLDRGLVDVPNVRRRLARLEPLEDHGGVDQPESVDHDLALHGLNGVDYDGN